MIRSLITKFTKILCHEDLELYSIDEDTGKGVIYDIPCVKNTSVRQVDI